MNLNIVNNFYDRSRESVDVIRKLFTRITENEYVKLKTAWRNNSNNSNASTQIFSQRELFWRNAKKPTLLANTIQNKAESLFPILRNPVVQHELYELHSTWICTLKWIVHPCMMKINAFFEESIAVPDSNLNKKLDYLKVINKELNVLNDGFYQYCEIYRLALLQIISADHNLEKFDVDEMEE